VRAGELVAGLGADAAHCVAAAGRALG
jgi:hypothetical protein